MTYIPQKVKDRVVARDGDRCVYCGTKVGYFEKSDLNKLEFDHFIPTSRGGSNTSSNIVISCKPCNRSKSSKDPGEIFSYNEYKRIRRQIASDMSVFERVVFG